MNWFQKIRAWMLAGVVLALLLGGCAYLLWEMRQSTQPDAVLIFDPAHPERNTGSPYYRVFKARWERVPLAELPWRAIVPGSETAQVPMAAVPASAPALRPRRDWNQPLATTVALAGNPWGRDVRRPQPAEVSMAHLPRQYLASMVNNKRQK